MTTHKFKEGDIVINDSGSSWDSCDFPLARTSAVEYFAYTDASAKMTLGIITAVGKQTYKIETAPDTFTAKAFDQVRKPTEREFMNRIDDFNAQYNLPKENNTYSLI